MYTYIGGIIAYDLFNSLAYYIPLIASIFLFNLRRKNTSIYTTALTNLASRFNNKLGKVVEFVLVSCESLLLVYLCDYAGYANRPFGELVGTGANYFALLFVAPVLLFIASLVFMANPLKQIDAVTPLVPFRLIFIKLACFCNGCCWGIPWEHGLYNHNIHHPGKQVPVQAIEAFFALVIFIFLLCYIKKAKVGTMYPMYIILYSATRFFSEFLTAAYPDVLGPFNMYQILCVIGFVVGLILFFIVRKYNDKLSGLCERPQKALEAIVTRIKKEKAQQIADEEIKRLARLEKAKLARKKAKARKK